MGDHMERLNLRESIRSLTKTVSYPGLPSIYYIQIRLVTRYLGRTPDTSIFFLNLTEKASVWLSVGKIKPRTTRLGSRLIFLKLSFRLAKEG